MSLSLRVENASQGTIDELITAVPQSGSFQPEITPGYGITFPDVIRCSYRVEGAMVVVTGQMFVLTEALAGPYYMLATIPFPMDPARQNDTSGWSSGVNTDYAGEIVSGPIVFETVNSVRISIIAAENTARQLALSFDYSYFMASPNPLAVVKDLPT